MGLNYFDARMMWDARRRGVSFEKTLTVAHLSLHLLPAELRSLRREYQATNPHSPATPLDGYMAGSYSDDFIRGFLGARTLEVIDDLFGQFVQRQPTMRGSQKPLVRWLERLILGDSASVGWTHQWMYDRFTLPALLTRAGFDEIRIVSASDSRIEGWRGFGLEIDTEGREHMPGSLRIEAVRPRSA